MTTHGCRVQGRAHGEGQGPGRAACWDPTDQERADACQRTRTLLEQESAHSAFAAVAFSLLPMQIKEACFIIKGKSVNGAKETLYTI